MGAGGEKVRIAPGKIICWGCFDQFRPEDRRSKYCSEECKKLVVKERREAWYLDNREKHLKQCKEWREKNPDRWRDINNAGVKEWRAKNPDKVKSQRYARRVREKEAHVEHVSIDVLIRRDRGKCMLCGDPVNLTAERGTRRAPSIDHVVPLSLGGEHSYENCQLAHIECNSKKGNRI